MSIAPTSSPAQPLDPPPAAGAPLLARLRLAALDIKLAHSIFALPYALLAAFMARGDVPWPAFAAQLALIIVCMVAARTWAMLINRLADRRFDAANPRTARRLIASGRLSARDGLTFALASALVFTIACAAFLLVFANPWPLILALPTLGWIALYSYTKRFTALCHLILGSALAFSPIAAAIAVNPAALTDTPALWFLAGMILLWVAGFDIIYALQDIDFDRETDLSSIPRTLGARGAIHLSRLFHAGAFALLIAAWWFGSRTGTAGASLSAPAPLFGPLFAAAVLLVGALLIAEHGILARRGKAGLDMAFFTINGIVSCVLGAAGIIDVLV